MSKFNKIINTYYNANPFVKFLSVSSSISASTTISTDIGNIISTIISEPEKFYEPIKTHKNFVPEINTYQKTI